MSYHEIRMAAAANNVMAVMRDGPGLKPKSVRLREIEECQNIFLTFRKYGFLSFTREFNNYAVAVGNIALDEKPARRLWAILNQWYFAHDGLDETYPNFRGIAQGFFEIQVNGYFIWLREHGFVTEATMKMWEDETFEGLVAYLESYMSAHAYLASQPQAENKNALQQQQFGAADTQVKMEDDDVVVKMEVGGTAVKDEAGENPKAKKHNSKKNKASRQQRSRDLDENTEVDVKLEYDEVDVKIEAGENPKAKKQRSKKKAKHQQRLGSMLDENTEVDVKLEYDEVDVKIEAGENSKPEKQKKSKKKQAPSQRRIAEKMRGLAKKMPGLDENTDADVILNYDDADVKMEDSDIKVEDEDGPIGMASIETPRPQSSRSRRRDGRRNKLLQKQRLAANRERGRDDNADASTKVKTEPSIFDVIQERKNPYLVERMMAEVVLRQKRLGAGNMRGRGGDADIEVKMEYGDVDVKSEVEDCSMEMGGGGPKKRKASHFDTDLKDDVEVKMEAKDDHTEIGSGEAKKRKV